MEVVTSFSRAAMLPESRITAWRYIEDKAVG